MNIHIDKDGEYTLKLTKREKEILRKAEGLCLTLQKYTQDTMQERADAVVHALELLGQVCELD